MASAGSINRSASGPTAPLPGASSENEYSSTNILKPFLLGDPMTNSRRAIRLDDSLLATQGTVYESFQTIDWLHDEDKERFYRKSLQMAAKAARRDRTLPRCSWAALLPQIVYLFYAVQGWLCLLMIGVCCGCCAAYVDIVALWFADLRSGYCSYAYWTSRETCCLLSNSIDGCDAWVSWSEHFGLSDGGVSSSSFAFDYATFVFVSVSLAVVAAYIVVNYAPYAAGSGISEVKTILSGFVIRKHLGKWTLFIKVLTMPLAVASGLALGKEGPMVHMAACIGNLMSYLFPKFERNAAKRRSMIAAAATAGVAVAFGAPIGGVLFALEEIAYYFPSKAMYRGFFCSLCAAATLQALNPYNTGELVLFQSPASASVMNKWSWFEVPTFALVGAVCGAIGALFIKINVSWSAVRKHTALKKWPLTEVFVVALITAVINYLSVFMRMDMLSLMALLFTPCFPDASGQFACVIDSSVVAALGLLVTALLKMGLCAFTSGLKIPVGIFVPSLAAGACIGRAFGAGFAYLVAQHGGVGSACAGHITCVDSSLYALLGAAALLCGVTRMTVALVVIMFEITGDVTVLTPIMITVLVAKWVASALYKDDIYVAQIKLQEYPFLDPKRDYGFRATISSVMRLDTEMEYLDEHGNTVDSLEDFLMRTRSNGFPVLSAEHSIVGYVSRNDLAYVISRALICADRHTPCILSELIDPSFASFVDVRPYMDPTPISIVHTTPFATATDIFRKTGARYMIVTRRGRVAGIVTRKDVLSFIYREELRSRENSKAGYRVVPVDDPSM